MMVEKESKLTDRLKRLERWENLIPDRDSLWSVQQVVKEAEKRKMPLSLRTLRFYVTEGLIKKPIHIGKEGFYEPEYIIPLLTLIYTLKTRFYKTLAEIKDAVYAQNALRVLELVHYFYEEYAKIRLTGIAANPLSVHMEEILFKKLKDGVLADKIKLTDIEKEARERMEE